MTFDDAFARRLIDAIPDALAITDAEGAIVFVNAACETMFRYPRTELIGRPIELLVPENRRAPHRQAREGFSRAPIERPMGNGTVLHGRRKDGSEIPVEVSLGTLPSSDGQFLMAVVRDATPRVRAAEALRRNEESLARAQRVAHVGSFDWDVTAGTVYRSAELCALFGVGPEEETAPPWSFTEMFHPDEREKIVALIRDAERVGHAYRVEHRIVRRDRVERVVLHQAETVREGERVVRVVGTMLDITDRKRIESEREQSLRNLEAVLDQCPVGIVLARGSRGEHLELNARAQALVGRPIDHVGQYPNLLFAPDEHTPIGDDEHPTLRALRGDRFDAIELALQQPQGPMLPVSVSGAPIVDASGAIQGAIVAFQDITAARQLERLRAEWSSIVAHDLRQPLNGIGLHAAMIRRALGRSPANTAAALQASETITRTTTRLGRMIDDLLDLSQLDARRIVLSRRPTDLVALVRNVIEPLEHMDHAPRFDVEVKGEIPRVSVDSDRIAQVIENLVSNAMKYGAPNAPIVVEIATLGDRVQIAVTNEGPCIPPEEMPRLFSRFVRAGDAVRGKVKGVGLGLHICRELIAAHGGEISASSAPGERTVFRISMPVRTAGLQEATT